jgi:hypothetical protein
MGVMDEVSSRAAAPLAAAPASAEAGAPRRRGRPSLMTQLALLERIQQLAARAEGLFRIHRTHSGLYARARRQFGSWSAAVRAAGVDYQDAIARARARSLRSRRPRGRRRPGGVIPE